MACCAHVYMHACSALVGVNSSDPGINDGLLLRVVFFSRICLAAWSIDFICRVQECLWSLRRHSSVRMGACSYGRLGCYAGFGGKFQTNFRMKRQRLQISEYSFTRHMYTFLSGARIARQ